MVDTNTKPRQFNVTPAQVRGTAKVTCGNRMCRRVNPTAPQGKPWYCSEHLFVGGKPPVAAAVEAASGVVAATASHGVLAGRMYPIVSIDHDVDPALCTLQLKDKTKTVELSQVTIVAVL